MDVSKKKKSELMTKSNDGFKQAFLERDLDRENKVQPNMLLLVSFLNKSMIKNKRICEFVLFRYACIIILVKLNN